MADPTLSGIVAYVRDLAASRTFYETRLGLPVVEADAQSARYSLGLVDLQLRAARTDGVQVEGHDDETSLIVVHVDDLDATRGALERRGVTLKPTLRYEIGATAALYDPDGHNITLYEPSEESLTWSSGERLRAILRTTEYRPAPDRSLNGAPLTYLFLFVRNTDEALAFYQRTLGLRVVEADPDAGVVKYDCGGAIVATHLVGGDAACAVYMDLSREKGIVATLAVDDLDAVYETLARERPAGDHQIVRDASGTRVILRDPNGHRFWITRRLSSERASQEKNRRATA